MVEVNSGRACKRRGAAVGVEHVNHHKRQVARVSCERPRAALACLLAGACLGRGGGELAQQRQLPFADDALCIVGVGAKDTADGAIIRGYWAVGKGVISFFGITVALHDQKLGFHIGALGAAHGLRQHRSDILPDLAPDYGGRLAERRRMLAPYDRLVRIVVEIDEVGSPADPDRLPGCQHDADGGAQAFWPGLLGTERGAFPIKAPNKLRELAFTASRSLRLNRASGKVGGLQRQFLTHYKPLFESPTIRSNDLRQTADNA